MLNSVVKKFQYGQHIITIESGMIARQTTATVMVSMDETSVLVTVVCAKNAKQGQDFLPLLVTYQERTYAAGRFPGSFFRREGRPSEGEILVSRLIDRPIRPLFPADFMNEIQITATVVSVNPEVNPDIVAMIGASAALSLSGVPFSGPIGSARVGYIDNNYILNPTTTDLSKSSLDLIISGTTHTILMVESKSKFLSEEQILHAIKFGHNQQKIVIHNINDFVDKVGKKNFQWKEIKKSNVKLINDISKLSESRFSNTCFISEKKSRYMQTELIKSETLDFFLKKNENFEEHEIKKILTNLEKKVVRNYILHNRVRIDGRKEDEIRPLDIRIGILPRTHGSALFTRGETQALVAATLGTERNAQNIDELTGERIDRFLFHYNFPSYCVGEIGIIGSPKRREIGHGNLARCGILAAMPQYNEFPYTIRIVSEITESNGSSSMASVCGASLALMDAGVPIKESVAGVAMGLIKEDLNFIILSDILGDEDHFGDMDFKVAGTRTGITALQMDIKIEGITYDILQLALDQAKIARFHILNSMEQIINIPRNKISKFAPRIHTIQINQDKIRNVIGKGGSIIRALTEETGTSIEIEDNGIIKIAATDDKKIEIAIKRIREITREIIVGDYYTGIVIRIMDFGAFISLEGGKEGLVHISQISDKRIEKVSDYLKIGQTVSVKVLETHRYGKIKLSIKEALIVEK